MSYGYVYVAQIAMGADQNQTLKAIKEAEAYNGPSIIIAYSPCEMHSIKGGMVNCQNEMKKAVDCGYWDMFRYNPALKAEGKNPFTIDSKPATADYKEFILGEARYASLTRSFPDRADALFDAAAAKAVERRKHLEKLQALYSVEE
jgi:pyruvate-ferredoxin/flavodoxin oxidoreductase